MLALLVQRGDLDPQTAIQEANRHREEYRLEIDVRRPLRMREIQPRLLEQRHSRRAIELFQNVLRPCESQAVFCGLRLDDLVAAAEAVTKDAQTRYSRPRPTLIADAVLRLNDGTEV